MPNHTDCFGKFQDVAEKCKKCNFASGCSCYTSTAPGIDRGFNFSSLDCLSDSCEVLIDPAPSPDENMDALPEERMFSSGELASFLRYLMELDNYTLEILREIIAPQSGKKCSIKDLCQLHNISRQSMHRKIFRVISKHPELRTLLRSTLDRLPPRQTA